MNSEQNKCARASSAMELANVLRCRIDPVGDPDTGMLFANIATRLDIMRTVMYLLAEKVNDVETRKVIFRALGEEE